MALLASAAAIGVHATWSYQPLTYGSAGGNSVWLPDGTLTSYETTPGPHIGAVDTSQVWNAPNTWFTAGIIVAISNHGRYGVTVDRVVSPPWGTDDRALLQPNTGASWSGGTKFHPFRLSPGREQLLTLTFRLSCMVIGADSYLTFSTIPVEYEFIGVHHTTTITLAQPLILKGPSNCSRS